jgi:multiple antibiotic resistance protein
MSAWLELVFTSSVALFILVGPFSALPIFATLAERRPARELPGIARRASVAGALVLALFAVAGHALLSALGLSIDAIRAAGGLVLLLMALDTLRGRPSSCGCSPSEARAAAEAGGDIALVPLAIPLLAGPGSIATVLTLPGTGGAAQVTAVLAAIGLVFFATYVILRSAVLVRRLLGPATLGAFGRVMGLLLAALSAQLLSAGIRGLMS